MEAGAPGDRLLLRGDPTCDEHPRTSGAEDVWRQQERESRTSYWFDLAVTPIYAAWKGKLIGNWPPPERAWWRWASRNTIPVAAILEESACEADVPPWEEIDLGWEELKVLPTRYRTKLSEWRAICFIWDSSDGKGYVGSAYGGENLLGRWLNSGQSGMEGIDFSASGIQRTSDLRSSRASPQIWSRRR